MAHKRIVENKTLKEILELPFSPLYSYQFLAKMYKENICPVVIDTLISDNTTKPPPESSVRQAGRPRNKRRQQQSTSEKERKKFVTNKSDRIIH
jgi:hypothetical protein